MVTGNQNLKTQKAEGPALQGQNFRQEPAPHLAIPVTGQGLAPTNNEVRMTTKWEKGDGRPRGGPHIENVKFWDLSDAELNYVMKDANAAMKANPDGKKAGKYADEVNDAATVLFWRKKNKIKVEK